MGLSSIKKEILVEASDNARDMRLERRLKRRCVANLSFKNNSRTKVIKRTPQTRAMEVILLDEDESMEETPQAVSAKDNLSDQDYRLYLSKLGNNHFNPSMGDDDLDPQYKMFWENVREDATSFVLEIAVDKDVHILLKYEEDDKLADEGRPGSPDNLGNVKKGENMENPTISKDFPARERKTLIDNKLRPDLHKKASSRDLASSEPEPEPEPEPETCDNGVDKSYKIFLDYVKPNNLRTVTKRENMENPKIFKDFPVRERKTLIDNKLPDLNRKASSRGLFSSEPKCEHEPEPEPCDTGIDESYKTFLECLKEEGSCLVFVNKHGKRVKYEEESESESEMLAAEGDPCIDEGKETPFIRSKPFGSSRIKNRNRTGHSQFRDKLMASLRKPYDQSEYEELLREILERKPLERHRDLRGRIKSYSLEICSKSYLDHHNDLKKKLDAVQGDCCKTLNLLRGFFYWLKAEHFMKIKQQSTKTSFLHCYSFIVLHGRSPWKLFFQLTWLMKMFIWKKKRWILFVVG